MTRRFVLAYLGAALCLTWAALTAIAYLRSRRPVPAPSWQEPDDGILPWDVPTTFTTSSSPDAKVTIRYH